MQVKNQTVKEKKIVHSIKQVHLQVYGPKSFLRPGRIHCINKASFYLYILFFMQ